MSMESVSWWGALDFYLTQLAPKSILCQNDYFNLRDYLLTLEMEKIKKLIKL